MPGTRSRTFVWRFDQPPEALWPALGDTARFNEAAGLPKHTIEEVKQEDGSVRFFARARQGGFRLEWEESPVEWVEGQWFRHLRVFSKGPLRDLCATLRLEPDGGGGSVCRYTVEVTARTLLGRLLVATVFFRKVEPLFGRLAREARDWAAGERERPFEFPPLRLSKEAGARVENLVSRLDASPNGHGLGRRLADWVLAAQEVDLMRIRPLALARLWSAPEREVVELCLQAVQEGLLELRWDLLCPRCRGAKVTSAALDQLPEAAHCESCNVGYDRRFAENVELSFRPAAAVRKVVDGEFCLFGPMSTPHVKVQAALGPGESRSLPARLAPGPYRLRTLEIGGAADVDHPGGGFPEVVFERGTVRPGGLVEDEELRLVNRGDTKRTFIVESREWVRDALTGHRATTLQGFRDLFPDAILRPGDEIDIAQVALIFTDLKGSTAFYERVGDAAAYRVVRRHFGFLARLIREHEGAIVKTIGDAVMAAFADPADAVRAALAVQGEVKTFNRNSGGDDIVIKMGLHAGPCIAVTLNGRLDYFGSAVNLAARLQGESRGGDIVLSGDVVADPGVRSVLDPSALEEGSAVLKGFGRPVPYWRLPAERIAPDSP